MNLQFLSLAFCNKFSDRGLLYLATGKCAMKMEYIDLSGCLQVTPQGFQNLANGCSNLTTLILDEFPTLLDESVMVRSGGRKGGGVLVWVGAELFWTEF